MKISKTLTLLIFCLSIAYFGIILAVGVNYWPQALAIALTFLVCLYIGIKNIKPKNIPEQTNSWKLALITAIIICGLTIYSTVAIFQHGVAV